jgi:hypothetical protein
MDGNIIQFPTEMSDAQISAALQRLYPNERNHQSWALKKNIESTDYETAEIIAENWIRNNPNVKPTYFQQLTPYLNRYQRFIVAVINPTLWIILIFALAMLAKRAVTWVWQGFNPQMKPKRENEKNSDG